MCPLWHLGFVSTVFPSLSIPNFITNELLKMQYGSYLTILLYVVLFALYGLLILVPYYMIYKQENFLLAAKHSTQKNDSSAQIMDALNWNFSPLLCSSNIYF